jgi:hypothetical protein
MSDIERERFEAHIRATWKVPADYLAWALSRDERGNYRDSRAADQFSGWQARAMLSASPQPPAVAAGVEPDDLRAMVGGLLGIGVNVRTDETIAMNIANLLRRTRCLDAIERAFFMVSEPDEDDPEGEPYDTCRMSWGATPDEYVEQMREALAALSTHAVDAADSADKGDAARLDWLERELDRESEWLAGDRTTPMPVSLFRRHMPITRAAIDAAIHSEARTSSEQEGRK